MVFQAYPVHSSTATEAIAISERPHPAPDAHLARAGVSVPGGAVGGVADAVETSVAERFSVTSAAAATPAEARFLGPGFCGPAFLVAAFFAVAFCAAAFLAATFFGTALPTGPLSDLGFSGAAFGGVDLLAGALPSSGRGRRLRGGS